MCSLFLAAPALKTMLRPHLQRVNFGLHYNFCLGSLKNKRTYPTLENYNTPSSQVTLGCSLRCGTHLKAGVHQCCHFDRLGEWRKPESIPWGKWRSLRDTSTTLKVNAGG